MINSPSLPSDSCLLAYKTRVLFLAAGLVVVFSTFYLFKHFLGVLLCLVNLKGNKRQEFKIESR